MHKLEYSLYFKIADDYLSFKGTFESFYDVSLSLFCQKNGLDRHKIMSKHHLRNYLHFIKCSSNDNSDANTFVFWSKTYDEMQFSGLSRIEFYKCYKVGLGVSSNHFYNLMKAVEFKRAFDEYKSTQAIESASLTVTSEEDGGEELVKVVNIQENSNAQDETVSTNVAANTPKSVASFTCNTTKLGTEIKVASNGHCISFNSETPERSVALVLKALGAS